MNLEKLLSEGNVEIRKTKDFNLGKGIEITYTKMYDAPDLSFKVLKELSDYFGTVEIDVDSSIRRGGCPTCDYGSCYGHYIQIYKITQNFPEGI